MVISVLLGTTENVLRTARREAAAESIMCRDERRWFGAYGRAAIPLEAPPLTVAISITNPAITAITSTMLSCLKAMVDSGYSG